MRFSAHRLSLWIYRAGRIRTTVATSNCRHRSSGTKKITSALSLAAVAAGVRNGEATRRGDGGRTFRRKCYSSPDAPCGQL
jgi:hypothetical protein